MSTPEERGETVVGIDTDTEALVGFGTWLHRAVHLPTGRELAIGIEWLGVDTAYQGQRTEEGPSIATTLFETLERRARGNSLSTPDMPLVLEVDARDEHAQGFWRHLGFEFVEWAEVANERYLRMLRSASSD